MTSHTLSRALGAALSCCLILPAAAFAADGEQTPLDLAETPVRTAQSAAGGGSTGGALVRTIVGLAIVLGVVYGLHWVLKQVKASKEERHAGSGLGTLATLPLGPNRSLHLVRAGTELVLVGVGEHGVTPIRTYSEDEARALGLLGDEDGGSSAGSGSGPARAPQASRLIEGLRARTVIR